MEKQPNRYLKIKYWIKSIMVLLVIMQICHWGWHNHLYYPVNAESDEYMEVGFGLLMSVIVSFVQILMMAVMCWAYSWFNKTHILRTYIVLSSIGILTTIAMAYGWFVAVVEQDWKYFDMITKPHLYLMIIYVIAFILSLYILIEWFALLVESVKELSDIKQGKTDKYTSNSDRFKVSPRVLVGVVVVIVLCVCISKISPVKGDISEANRQYVEEIFDVELPDKVGVLEYEEGSVTLEFNLEDFEYMKYEICPCENDVKEFEDNGLDDNGALFVRYEKCENETRLIYIKSPKLGVFDVIFEVK